VRLRIYAGEKLDNVRDRIHATHGPRCVALDLAPLRPWRLSPRMRCSASSVSKQRAWPRLPGRPPPDRRAGAIIGSSVTGRKGECRLSVRRTQVSGRPAASARRERNGQATISPGRGAHQQVKPSRGSVSLGVPHGRAPTSECPASGGTWPPRRLGALNPDRPRDCVSPNRTTG
jgi:hypothetical protein